MRKLLISLMAVLTLSGLGLIAETLVVDPEPASAHEMCGVVTVPGYWTVEKVYLTGVFLLEPGEEWPHYYVWTWHPPSQTISCGNILHQHCEWIRLTPRSDLFLNCYYHYG